MKVTIFSIDSKLVFYIGLNLVVRAPKGVSLYYFLLDLICIN